VFIIKFHKVPELFPNRKVRTVRTEQLCEKWQKTYSREECIVCCDGECVVPQRLYKEKVQRVFSSSKVNGISEHKHL